jgi:hypothetical protein
MRSRAIGAAAALGLFCWTFPALAQEVGAIGYATVAEALDALRADPTATERTERGWIVIERAGDLEIWSFTPQGHPAHPSAAKRTAYQSADGGWHVITNLLCGSTKANCDALMEQYRQLDAQMKERIRRERGSGI